MSLLSLASRKSSVSLTLTAAVQASIELTPYHRSPGFPAVTKAQLIAIHLVHILDEFTSRLRHGTTPFFLAWRVCPC